MKLELKHLVPYLPYNLKITDEEGNKGIMIALYSDCLLLNYDLNVGDYEYNFDDIKPLLIPLSEIKKHWIPDGSKFHKNLLIDCYMHPNYDPTEIIKNRIQTNTLKWIDANTLFQHHYDVFGLIPAGLALPTTEMEGEK